MVDHGDDIERIYEETKRLLEQNEAIFTEVDDETIRVCGLENDVKKLFDLFYEQLKDEPIMHCDLEDVLRELLKRDEPAIINVVMKHIKNDPRIVCREMDEIEPDPIFPNEWVYRRDADYNKVIEYIRGLYKDFEKQDEEFVPELIPPKPPDQNEQREVLGMYKKELDRQLKRKREKARK